MAKYIDLYTEKAAPIIRNSGPLWWHKIDTYTTKPYPSSQQVLATQTNTKHHTLYSSQLQWNMPDVYKRQVQAVQPELSAGMCFVDMSDYALERLDAERRLDAKRARMNTAEGG